MMAVVPQCSADTRDCPSPVSRERTIRIGLLGLGQVGSALARLILARPRTGDARIEITTGLVRDPARPRVTRGVAHTCDPEAVFGTQPTVIVEALGGLEPARTLVLEAIARGIPVVTANKSLLAHHGDELLEAAARAGVPLRYEASVIAGVPFLGTFARRPYASALSAFSGILNGTTNFILSQMADRGCDYASALAGAQRRGFAEPDPSKDVGGVDAAEKLTILIRQFAGVRVDPGSIETTGIERVTSADLAGARALEGTLKPVVYADVLEQPSQRLSSGTLKRDSPRGHSRLTVPGEIAAFAGPAFVRDEHPLARVHQADNGLCLRTISGNQLCFTGPGAGPDATAITLLDDVLEAASPWTAPWSAGTARAGRVAAPTTGWLLQVTSDSALPPAVDIADLLGAHDVWAERTTPRDTRDGRERQSFLIYPCNRPVIERAATALAAATGSSTHAFRALEALA
jgi:homoserine dehydrogenase